MSRSTRRTSARSPSRSRRKEEEEEEEVVVQRSTRNRSTSRARSSQAAAAPTPSRASRSRSTSRARKAADEEPAPAKKEPKRRNDGFDPKTAAAEASSKSRTRSRSRDRTTATPKKSSSKRTEEPLESSDEAESSRKPESDSEERGAASKSDAILAEAEGVINSSSATITEIEKVVEKLESLSQEVQEALSQSKGTSRRGTRQTRDLEDKLDAIVAAASAAQHKVQVLQAKAIDVSVAEEQMAEESTSEKEPPVTLDSSFYGYAALSFIIFFISQFLVVLSNSTWLRDGLDDALTYGAKAAGFERFITTAVIRRLTQPTMNVLTLSIVTSVIQLIATFPLKYWAAEKQPNSAAARRFVRFVTSFIGSILAIGIWLHFNAFRATDSPYASRAIFVYLFAFYSHSLIAHADAATWPHVAECAIQLFAASVCLFMNKSIPFVDRSVNLVLFLRVCALAVHSIGSVGLFALTNRTAVSRGMTAVAYACSYLYLFVSIVTPLAVLVRGFVPPYSVKLSEAFAALALIALNGISLLDDATPANSAVPFN